MQQSAVGEEGLHQAFLGAVAARSLRCTSLEAAHTWCTSTQTGVGELELLEVGLKMGSGWWAARIQAHGRWCWSCSIGPAPYRDESSPLCLTPGGAVGFRPTARDGLYGCLGGGSRFSIGFGICQCLGSSSNVFGKVGFVRAGLGG